MIPAFELFFYSTKVALAFYALRILAALYLAFSFA